MSRHRLNLGGRGEEGQTKTESQLKVKVLKNNKERMVNLGGNKLQGQKKKIFKLAGFSLVGKTTCTVCSSQR